ncbi:MAG: hypothetical protein VX835_02780 [Pseudomonadota bacterium]|nr:hypothetical protein [Pseudomonadota bacterium]
MESLNLASEIQSLSRKIYRDEPFSPYSTNPLLANHDKTCKLLQNASSFIYSGDIHANFKDEFDSASIAILKTIPTPKNIMSIIDLVLFEDNDTEPKKAKLNESFAKGIKYYQSQFSDMGLIDVIEHFFINEINLPKTEVSNKLADIQRQYINHQNPFVREIIESFESIEADIIDFKLLKDNTLMQLWQLTLQEVVTYFDNQKVEHLYDVKATYALIQSFNHNLSAALINCKNKKLVKSIIEDLIGHPDNENFPKKDIHPMIRNLWENSQLTANTDNLVSFIKQLTGLPKSFIRDHINDYDQIKDKPTYEPLDPDSYLIDVRYENSTTETFKTLLETKLNGLHKEILRDIGVVKTYDNQGNADCNLKYLASKNIDELSAWLKLQTMSQLNDFKKQYKTLVESEINHGSSFDGAVSYHWVTQFYWMMLNRCHDHHSRETNVLFYKILTDCLVATNNYFRCFAGVYQDAMMTTQSLHQAFNQTTKKEYHQLKDAYSEISMILFEHSLPLYKNGAIDPNLFYWWHDRESKTIDNNLYSYHKENKLNDFLFEGSQSNLTYVEYDSQKQNLLKIRAALIEDLFTQTSLNLDTCYAVADYLNLTYYVQRNEQDPNSIWELIAKNVVYCEDDDTRNINDDLFKPIEEQLKHLPGLINDILTHCDQDVMPAISPNINMGILKNHDINTYNFIKKISEKRAKLLLSFEPETFFQIMFENTSNQHPEFTTWLNQKIPYLPIDLATHSYFLLITKFNMSVDKITFTRHKDSMFFSEDPIYDAFFNMILFDMPVLNEYKNRCRPLTYYHVESITHTFFKLSGTLKLNLNTCHQLVQTMAETKNLLNPDWANFYFNWMAYSGMGTREEKKALFNNYFNREQTAFRDSLNCSQDIQALKLLHICPDEFKTIIDHYLDNLPEDTDVVKQELHKSLVFIYYPAKQNLCYLNQYNFSVRWLYFMYALKDKQNLSPVKQKLHDLLKKSMHNETNKLTNWYSRIDNFFMKKLDQNQILEKWLYHIALDLPNAKKLTKLDIQQNYEILKQPKFNLLRRWLPYSKLYLNDVILTGDVITESIDDLENYANDNSEMLSTDMQNNLDTQINYLRQLSNRTCQIS